jgi:cytochrome b561
MSHNPVTGIVFTLSTVNNLFYTNFFPSLFSGPSDPVHVSLFSYYAVLPWLGWVRMEVSGRKCSFVNRLKPEIHINNI